MQKSPTCAYIGQNSFSDFHINGGPHVANSWLSASNFHNSVPAMKNWENKLTLEKKNLTANLKYINKILYLPGTPDAFRCSNIFKVTVNCFPSSLRQEQCHKFLHNPF